MAFSGLNVEAARALARQLVDGAATLDSLSAGINTALYSTPWDGPDADTFREQWESLHKLRLTEAVTHLGDAAEQLLMEAGEQATASENNVLPGESNATRSDGLPDKYRGLSGAQWLLAPGDAAGGIAGARLEYNSNATAATAKVFQSQASRDLSRALASDPSATGRQGWYQAIDDAKQFGSSADDLAQTSRTMERSSKLMPIKVGGVLAGLGIGYDIANGKEPVQAVTAGAGGFLASVGAGAVTGSIIGSFVPVPGVGTAAGAVIGAGVGVFTSGAIDSLFENGPDVAKAAEAGWDTVRDTGGAIGHAIGGLF